MGRDWVRLAPLCLPLFRHALTLIADHLCAARREEDPAKVEARQKDQIVMILKRLEDGQREERDAAYRAALSASDSSENSSESDDERQARRRRRRKEFKKHEREQKKFYKRFKRQPAILIVNKEPPRYCGLTRSHWILCE